jgi:hypothetical protein
MRLTVTSIAVTRVTSPAKNNLLEIDPTLFDTGRLRTTLSGIATSCEACSTGFITTVRVTVSVNVTARPSERTLCNEEAVNK